MFRNRILACLVLLLGVGVYVGSRPTTQPFLEATEPEVPAESVQTAVFAGGCFWSVEAPFEELPGVIKSESGYTAGRTINPTYKDVAFSDTGHFEAVRVTFDSRRITYNDLLEIFWRNIDPTDEGGQFFDRGESYRTAIFVADQEQRIIAEASKAKLEASKRFTKKIVTPIRDAETFYLAEDYHQDFYKKSPERYEICHAGRRDYIKQIWGADLKYEIPSRSLEGGTSGVQAPALPGN